MAQFENGSASRREMSRAPRVDGFLQNDHLAVFVRLSRGGMSRGGGQEISRGVPLTQPARVMPHGAALYEPQPPDAGGTRRHS
jgi:hypothetical protein